MITEVNGSIFDSKTQTIVNTTNCLGVMGKGIALEFKYRYPKMFDWYSDLCSKSEVKPGKLSLWTESKPWILNFPTKDDWRYPSKMDFIKKGLESFVKEYKNMGITSISFPRLGTNSGGLIWSEVKELMYNYLGTLDIDILIYNFDSKASDSLFFRLKDLILNRSLDDIKKSIGINKKISESLKNKIKDGSITSMFDLTNIKGLGDRSIVKIYDYLMNKYKEKQTSLII